MIITSGLAFAFYFFQLMAFATPQTVRSREETSTNATASNQNAKTSWMRAIEKGVDLTRYEIPNAKLYQVSSTFRERVQQTSNDVSHIALLWKDDEEFFTTQTTTIEPVVWRRPYRRPSPALIRPVFEWSTFHFDLGTALKAADARDYDGPWQQVRLEVSLRARDKGAIVYVFDGVPEAVPRRAIVNTVTSEVYVPIML